MTEKEKNKLGLIYDPNNDLELIKEREISQTLCMKYNNIGPSDKSKREEILKSLLGSIGNNCTMEQPIHFDYGYNTYIGDNFFSNYNFTVLDCAEVHIGNNVFIGPNVSIYTPLHPLNYKERNKGLETSKKVVIEDNVWIAGSVTILPGVTIGANSVIGAGSVVTKDIPSNSLAFGNPCTVKNKIDVE